jgi:hypothetical protein
MPARVKNYVAAETEVLHWQTFTNSHFHFCIFLQQATSQVTLERPK